METADELYSEILGVDSPWRVVKVARDEVVCRITVTVEFVREETGALGGHIHGYVERSWRHLASHHQRHRRGLNSKIQALRANARGLPKFETFRVRVLFQAEQLFFCNLDWLKIWDVDLFLGDC